MNTEANSGCTRLASRRISPTRATAMMPSTGSPMPAIRKPAVAGTASAPACRPSSGGRIRLPAPKNIENSMPPSTSSCMRPMPAFCTSFGFSTNPHFLIRRRASRASARDIRERGARRFHSRPGRPCKPTMRPRTRCAPCVRPPTPDEERPNRADRYGLLLYIKRTALKTPHAKRCKSGGKRQGGVCGAVRDARMQARTAAARACAGSSAEHGARTADEPGNPHDIVENPRDFRSPNR